MYVSIKKLKFRISQMTVLHVPIILWLGSLCSDLAGWRGYSKKFKQNTRKMIISGQICHNFAQLMALETLPFSEKNFNFGLCHKTSL